MDGTRRPSVSEDALAIRDLRPDSHEEQHDSRTSYGDGQRVTTIGSDKEPHESTQDGLEGASADFRVRSPSQASTMLSPRGCASRVRLLGLQPAGGKLLLPITGGEAVDGASRIPRHHDVAEEIALQEVIP